MVQKCRNMKNRRFLVDVFIYSLNYLPMFQFLNDKTLNLYQDIWIFNEKKTEKVVNVLFFGDVLF